MQKLFEHGKHISFKSCLFICFGLLFLFVILAVFAVAYVFFINTSENPLLIGAFNVQVFGQSKIEESEVVDVLIQIISRYDLILIQEIRDKKQTALLDLMTNLNSHNDNLYEFEVGKRVGRTNSKEQYAFIFRKDKLEILSMYETDDKHDVFEREPLVVRFQRKQNTGVVKEFTFIPIHTKPSDAVSEINGLIDVYEESIKHYGQEAILAGDFNADCNYVRKSEWTLVKLRSDLRFSWLIDDDVDTTVGKTHCAYDRIILAGSMLRKHACCARVYRFDKEFQLLNNQTEDVSDHYPVEFILY